MQTGGERESPIPWVILISVANTCAGAHWISMVNQVLLKDKATPRVILTFLFFFNHLRDATLICEL